MAKTETPILRRLGPVPYWRGERRCLDQLDEIYRKAMEAAQRALGAPAPVSRRPLTAPPASGRGSFRAGR